MPVLPEVDSTIVLRPGSILPSASAASIMATPILSLTLPAGLYASSFAISSAPQFGATRVRRTIGVFPIRSARLSVMARVGGETLTPPRLPGLLPVDRIAYQPEHRRPEPYEERTALGIAALLLVHCLRADPERDAQPDRAERDDVEMPSTHAHPLKSLAYHRIGIPAEPTGMQEGHAPTHAHPPPGHSRALASRDDTDVLALPVAHHPAVPRRGRGILARGRPATASGRRRARGPAGGRARRRPAFPPALQRSHR